MEKALEESVQEKKVEKLLLLLELRKPLVEKLSKIELSEKEKKALKKIVSIDKKVADVISSEKDDLAVELKKLSEKKIIANKGKRAARSYYKVNPQTEGYYIDKKK